MSPHLSLRGAEFLLADTEWTLEPKATGPIHLSPPTDDKSSAILRFSYLGYPIDLGMDEASIRDVYNAPADACIPTYLGIYVRATL